MMQKLLSLLLLLSLFVTKSYAQPSSFVKQINASAVPIDNTLSFVNTFSSPQGKAYLNHLQSLKALGLGEASHGTHEYFVAKANLIKQLLPANHYDLISLEAPYAEVELLNQYILKGTGNLKVILKSFRQYTYETAEFADFINFLQTYNKTAKLKVLFYGCDFQSPYQVLNNLKTAAHRNKAASAALDSLQVIFSTLSDALYAHQVDSASYNKILSYSNTLQVGLKASADAAIHSNLKNYQQFLLLNEPAYTKADLEHTSALRDSLMARNVLDEIEKGHNFLVWAHNGHVQKMPNTFSKTMGQHLSAQLKNQYAAIGFSSYAGYFTAYNNDEQGVVKTNALDLPNETQFEFYLHQAEHPNFIFSSSKVNAPVNANHYRFQVYGVTENQFQQSNLLQDFDYITFIGNTTGSLNYYLKKSE